MILVTAPTSSIGRQVVDHLLERGAPLRLVTRDPARLGPAVRDRVEVVAGSHGDGEVIGRAADGVEAAFWLSPNDPDAPTLAATFVDFARPASEAFAAHGVGRVVGISALGRGTPAAAHAGLVTASLAMDDLFAASGVAYRAVVNPSFMDNILNQTGAIGEQGRWFGVTDPGLVAPTVATRDIAATAADLLLDGSWEGVGEVPCLGPEDLSADQQAAILSEVLGTTVTYQQIPGRAFTDRMTGFGMGKALAQGLVDMFEAKNAGLDNAEARTVASTTPTTWRRWCEEVLVPAMGA